MLKIESGTGGKPIRHRFGIPMDDYNAKHEAQGGVCAICKNPETETTRTGRAKCLIVDRSLATGMVRDLLCRNCKQVLVLMRDDPTAMRNAARWIEMEREAA